MDGAWGLFGLCGHFRARFDFGGGRAGDLAGDKAEDLGCRLFERRQRYGCGTGVYGGLQAVANGPLEQAGEFRGELGK